MSPDSTSMSPDVLEIEHALAKIAYLITRVRRHELIRVVSGIPIDRAAAVILRHLAEFDEVRPGEVAAQLEVEAPHVTRQMQLLEELGYVERVPDVNDRRAHLIRMTPEGREAADRIREVSRQTLDASLEQWSSKDVHELARLFSRMVDDYVAYAAYREVEHRVGPRGAWRRRNARAATP